MDDIELIIKIPKDYYEILRKNDIIINGLRSGKTFTYVICKAVANGTPIPKSHGRIGDIDKLIDSKCNECGHLKGVSCTIPCYAVRRMLDTPTIIEADKEEK